MRYKASDMRSRLGTKNQKKEEQPFPQSPSRSYFWAEGSLASQLDVKGIVFFEGSNIILKELTKGVLLAFRMVDIRLIGLLLLLAQLVEEVDTNLILGV